MNTVYINKAKQIFLVLLLVVASGIIGCKKGTFDINSPNPNALSPSTVPAKYILASSLAATANLVFGGDGDIINTWMGYWSTSGGFTPSPIYVSYQLTGGVASGNFDDAYLNMANYQSIINNAAGNATQANYRAAALIMKSFVMQRVVDLYNSVPYTQAFNPSNLNPKYDDPAAIYNDLLAKIDTAIILINNGGTTATAIDAKYDVLFGGDLTKWVQFANTLKLKIVMRLSATSTGAATAQKELSGLTSASFLSTDAAVNPGYSAAADNQENPYFLDVNLRANNGAGTNRNYWRACTYAVNYYKSTNDPRLNVLYEVKKSGVWGLDLGTLVVASNDSISGVFGTAYAGAATQSCFILPAYESYLLQAEAVQRGYMTGDAASLYASGVTASFVLTNAKYSGSTPTASAASYLANNAAVNFAAASDKIAVIITQKWASSNAVDPLESYSDYRRTGFPKTLPVSVAPQNTQTHIPWRLVYPTSETSYNASNVPSGTDQNTKVFWMP